MSELEAIRQVAGCALVVFGVMVISVGTIGLVRLRDGASRLHLLTKTDNLGLGGCVVGLGLLGGNLYAAALMAVTWAIVVFAGASAAQLLADTYRGEERD